jgi:hypothetical protein
MKRQRDGLPGIQGYRHTNNGPAFPFISAAEDVDVMILIPEVQISNPVYLAIISRHVLS